LYFSSLTFSLTSNHISIINKKSKKTRAESGKSQYFQEKEKDVAENAEKTAEIEMIKISAAVNSGRSPAEKQGQKQGGTRIFCFSLFFRISGNRIRTQQRYNLFKKNQDTWLK